MKFNRLLLLCAAWCAPALAMAGGDKAMVYAGGVAGIEALANEEASKVYRAAGGGLYLHHSGWMKLNDAQRKAVAKIWKRQPAAFEFGFMEPSPEAWARTCRDQYLELGLKPDFIAANAFQQNTVPTLEEWLEYMEALYDEGLSKKSRIYPTFEYANFGANKNSLSDNTVSKREDFQAILRAAGGIVIDSPPGHFFDRDKEYQKWVVDALEWCHEENLDTVVIFSPHHSGEEFDEDSRKFLRHLKNRHAVPRRIVSENYEGNADADYINVVGDEKVPHTALGVAWLLIQEWQ